MADLIVREQSKHAAPLLMSALRVAHDVLSGDSGHVATPPMAIERIEQAISGVAVGARTQTRFTSNCLGNMYVRLDLSQVLLAGGGAGGNHSAYLYQAIDSVRILAGSNEIWTMPNFSAGFKAALMHAPESLAAGVLAACAGGTQVAKTVCIAIPAPWTILGQGGGDENGHYRPLPTWKAASPELTLEIQWTGASGNACTATDTDTTTFTGASLVFHDLVFDRTSMAGARDAPVALHGVEYQAYPNETPAGVLGSDQFDASAVQGTIRSMMVFDSGAAASFSTGEVTGVFSSGTVTVDNVLIDGRSFHSAGTDVREHVIESALLGYGRCAGDFEATLESEEVPIVPFCAFPRSASSMYGMGLPTSDIRQLSLVLSSSAAVEQYQVVAITNWLCTLDGHGRWLRKRP